MTNSGFQPAARAINASGPTALAGESPQASAARAGLPRWVDVALAGAALLVALPALLVAAAAVKLSSSGPVFFRQERVGRAGRPFYLIKFRTWRQQGDRPPVTAGNNPLITPVGRLLRKTKLDEVPSFWNVVRGDMSLVGPRPEVPRLVDLDDPLWTETLSARPGITDSVTLALRNEQDLMAQAQLRFGDLELFYRHQLQRWKLDGYVRYLRQRNAWTDALILLQTALSIIGWSRTGPPTLADILTVSEGRNRRADTAVRWWPSTISRPTQLVLDAMVVSGTFVLAYVLRFDFTPAWQDIEDIRVQLPLVVAVHLAALWLAGAHRVIWRYITLLDQKRFVLAVAGAAAVLMALRLALPDGLRTLRVPLSVTVVNAALAFLALTGIRGFRRFVFESWERDTTAGSHEPATSRPVLFIGAGRAGLLAVREVLARGDSQVDVKGFVDDDPAKTGSLIHGVPVLGTTNDLARLVREFSIDHVLLTIIGADTQELQRITAACEGAGVPLRILPNLHDILQGRDPAPEPPAA